MVAALRGVASNIWTPLKGTSNDGLMIQSKSIDRETEESFHFDPVRIGLDWMSCSHLNPECQALSCTQNFFPPILSFRLGEERCVRAS